MPDFSTMTLKEALEYCYKYESEYVKDCGSVDEGIRQFACLILILEEGTIEPTDLPDYGMEY